MMLVKDVKTCLLPDCARPGIAQQLPERSDHASSSLSTPQSSLNSHDRFAIAPYELIMLHTRGMLLHELILLVLRHEFLFLPVGDTVSSACSLLHGQPIWQLCLLQVQERHTQWRALQPTGESTTAPCSSCSILCMLARSRPPSASQSAFLRYACTAQQFDQSGNESHNGFAFADCCTSQVLTGTCHAHQGMLSQVVQLLVHAVLRRHIWIALMTCCGRNRRGPGQSWKCAAGLLGHTCQAWLRNRSGSTQSLFCLCFLCPSLPILCYSLHGQECHPDVALYVYGATPLHC